MLKGVTKLNILGAFVPNVGAGTYKSEGSQILTSTKCSTYDARFALSNLQSRISLPKLLVAAFDSRYLVSYNLTPSCDQQLSVVRCVV